jgi:hypothetical protein
VGDSVCSVDGFICSVDGFACSGDGSVDSVEGFRYSAGGFLYSGEGFVCSGDGFVYSADGLIYSADGFFCSADGFIYSVEARNWWVDAISSIRAVNITFGLALETYAEPPICCNGAKLTVAGPGKYSLLPNFVVDSAPRSFSGARKTIGRANKTVGGCRMCSFLGRNAPVADLALESPPRNQEVSSCAHFSRSFSPLRSRFSRRRLETTEESAVL